LASGQGSDPILAASENHAEKEQRGGAEKKRRIAEKIRFRGFPKPSKLMRGFLSAILSTLRASAFGFFIPIFELSW
jgi:hypothetical protein